MATNEISVTELRRHMRHRDVVRCRGLSHVLELCYAHVLRAAEARMTRCEFEVPVFVVGVPPYDVDECVRFAVANLVRHGYLVRVAQPDARVLSISWDEDDEAEAEAADAARRAPVSRHPDPVVDADGPSNRRARAPPPRTTGIVARRMAWHGTGAR